MAETAGDLLQDLAVKLKGTSTAPTSGTAEWLLWLEQLNEARKEWAKAARWPVTRRLYSFSGGENQTSAALPTNFLFVGSFLKVDSKDEYPEIPPDQTERYDASDEYFYPWGNPVDGYSLQINPALDSGASCRIQIHTQPSALVSDTSKILCPSPEFLVQSAYARILEQKKDGRAPGAKEDANDILRKMMVGQFTPSVANTERVESEEKKRYGFRWGIDG